MYSKNFKNGGEWDNVTLSDEEVQEVQEQLRAKNLEIMKKCLRDSKGLNDCINSTIAAALFSKLGESGFTVLQNALEHKARKIKDSENGKWKPIKKRLSKAEFDRLHEQGKIRKFGNQWQVKED